MTASSPLLRARDVGKILGLSDQGVLNLVRGGRLTAVIFRAGGRRDTFRFRPADVEAFIRANLREGRVAG